MNEPITLTERERAVFDALAEFLAESSGTVTSLIGRYIFDWLAIQPMESASPPRVTVGITGPVLPVESGPGRPIDIDKARRVVNLWRDARGLDAPIPWETTLARFIADALTAERRAGIEAAAKYHDDQAAEWSEHYTKNGNDPSAREYAKQHSADAAAIRALADAPEVKGG